MIKYCILICILIIVFTHILNDSGRDSFDMTLLKRSLFSEKPYLYELAKIKNANVKIDMNTVNRNSIYYPECKVLIDYNDGKRRVQALYYLEKEPKDDIVCESYFQAVMLDSKKQKYNKSSKKKEPEKKIYGYKGVILNEKEFISCVLTLSNEKYPVSIEKRLENEGEIIQFGPNPIKLVKQ